MDRFNEHWQFCGRMDHAGAFAQTGSTGFFFNVIGRSGHAASDADSVNAAEFLK